MNFDKVFYSHLDGVVHTCLLNFGFKPSVLIGYQMWYDHCLPDCLSFKDFIDYLSQRRRV